MKKCYIKINPDEVSVHGDRDEILALYGTLTHELLECGISKEEIEMTLELVFAEDMGKKTDEIIKRKKDSAKQELLETFKKLLFGEE